MTQLINSYNSLQAEIQKLSLEPNPQSLPEDPSCLPEHEYKAAILASIQRTNLKCYTVEDLPSKGIIEVCGLYDQLFGLGFQLFVKVRVYLGLGQIGIWVGLMRNFVPFKVKGKANRIQMSKYILKTNANIKYGSFRMDPHTGQLILTFTNTLTHPQFHSLLTKPNQLPQYLQSQFLKSKYYYRTYILKILYLLNQVSGNYAEDPEVAGCKVKGMGVGYGQLEGVANRILRMMHLEENFFYSDLGYTGTRQLSVGDAKRISQEIKAALLFAKQMPTTIKKIQKLLAPTPKRPQKLEQPFSEQRKRDFVAKLMQPIVRYQTGQLPNIYSEIQIINAMGNWEVIDQGGFGVISKGWVKFGFKLQMGLAANHQQQGQQQGRQGQLQQGQESQSAGNLINLFTRQIVKKEDHEQEARKLSHQKQILSTLKNFSSPFIAKFYYSEQDDYKNALLIEYCSQKSLSLLKLRNNEFLSLGSKLVYLKHLAQGIKFLKDHQICHLDIKPSNLLFGSGIVKITDFGEAYHPQVCLKNFRPGTSIPYAPPESFSAGLINFHPKIDIFSFGMVMHQLLYDCYPLEYSRHRYQFLKKCYSQKSYSNQVLLAPQKVLRQGYSGLHYILKFMALRCIEEDERKRPCIQWIVILLGLCINLELLLSN